MNDKVTIELPLDVAKWLYQYCKINFADDSFLRFVKLIGDEELVSMARKDKMYYLECIEILAPVCGL